ncbi:MAG: hypothetical protein ABIR62_07855 [Dokdonella sp.]|uniref:hypothetical protein n=1 Tax=Dokdonella sp. TaxID=2291710 RepID=UPI003264FC61
MKVLLAFAALIPIVAVAEPTCVVTDARNVVLATGPSDLTDGWGGNWLLQNVETSDRIFLRRCSAHASSDTCYYAVNVVPGKYYFQEAVPGAKNSLSYPVSRKALWFQVTGMGVDYIGDWTIERDSFRVVKKLEIRYSLKHLEEMVGLCKITGKKQYLSRTQSPAREIVD